MTPKRTRSGSGSEWASVHEAAAALGLRGVSRPEASVVLGSGLSGFVEGVGEPRVVPYDEIPGFPLPAVPGHHGALVEGVLGGRRVIVLSGRVHFYEGRTAADVVFAVRLAHALGTQVLIATNAAGGIDPAFEPGDLMLIADQISLLGGRRLLTGTPTFRPAGAYTPRLRTLARRAALDAGLVLRDGVYLGWTGPTYETPAEIALARTLGAHAVGMSTVAEVQAASALGMEVLGLSLVSNIPLPGRSGVTTHEEVLAAGRARAARLLLLVSGVLERL
jgi:purine-nucleoside phosphorylase